MILCITDNKLIVDHGFDIRIINNTMSLMDSNGHILLNHPVEKNSFNETIIANLAYNNNTVRKRVVIHPGIFINTLPKSGSMYIWNVLQKGLILPARRLSLHRFKYDGIVTEWAQEFNEKKNRVVQEHLPATRVNLLQLKQYNVVKLIVHVRDPRQSIISMIHHIDKTPKPDAEIGLLDMDIPINNPYDYYISLSMKEKIDLLLLYYLQQQIDWIKDWLIVSKKPESGFEILFTSFIDMKENPAHFFESILKFYNINFQLWFPPNNYQPQKDKLHYRKGASNEWRDIFSPEQTNIAREMIPLELFDTFNWDY